MPTSTEYERHELHGLPHHVDIDSLLPDPDGRAGHWLHPSTKETFRLHPDFPNPPKQEAQATPLGYAIGELKPHREYVVLLPNGSEVVCADRKSASELLALVHGGSVPQEIEQKAITERDGEPTPEEIARIQAKIAEDEAIDRREIEAVKATEGPKLQQALEAAVQHSAETTGQESAGGASRSGPQRVRRNVPQS